MAAKQILLVEGKDDEHVFRALFGRSNLPQPIIYQHEGYSRLLEAIPERLRESDVQAVGIVLDADTDLDSRWGAVRHRLQTTGYSNLPAQPDAVGLVLPSPPRSILPKAGVWLMPNNRVPGILEDFLRYLVPPGPRLVRVRGTVRPGHRPSTPSLPSRGHAKSAHPHLVGLAA